MIEASAVDTPTKRNRAGDQMTPGAGNMAANAYRPKSFADNLNYRQKSGEQMPTPSRDTWKDWFDDADQVPQLTRDELVEFIARRSQPGEAVTSTTLRYWENAGVMPGPVRRWHNGATRALYPRPYALMAIFIILNMQSRGFTLAEITHHLPRRLKAYYVEYDVLDKWKSRAIEMASEFADATGIAPRKVEIVFIDDDGTEHVHGFEIEE